MKDLRRKLVIIVRQIDAARTRDAKRFYADLLLRYRTYDPVGTRGIA